uniref:Uncharacterized protein n=1 Tax=Vespula pensylvanica TaxID=30213 RepID=A0A834UD83_VESPE|nr:hypothetical protein H0235_004805 [Vespula pensylvanica]
MIMDDNRKEYDKEQQESILEYCDKPLWSFIIFYKDIANILYSTLLHKVKKRLYETMKTSSQTVIQGATELFSKIYQNLSRMAFSKISILPYCRSKCSYSDGRRDVDLKN